MTNVIVFEEETVYFQKMNFKFTFIWIFNFLSNSPFYTQHSQKWNKKQKGNTWNINWLLLLKYKQNNPKR